MAEWHNVDVQPDGEAHFVRNQWTNAKVNRVTMAEFVNRDPAGFVAFVPKDFQVPIVESTSMNVRRSRV